MIDSGSCHVLADGRVEFVVRCRVCETPYTFVVMPDQLEAWLSGAFVQDAFPNMPPEWREMLISGTCPSCFDDMFPIGDE